MLSADSYRAPVLLFLKAKGSIKDHPGFVLYGNPPRWHKYDPGKHTDAGQTHYHAKKQLEVKAAQQIASEGSHGHDGTSPEDQVAKMKSLATEHQAKASASAAVTGWKKAMMAGKAPTKSQHDAMVALMATNRDKAKKIASEVVAAIGAEKYQALLDQAEGKAAKPAKSQASSQPESSAPAKPEPQKPAAKPKADPKPADPFAGDAIVHAMSKADAVEGKEAKTKAFLEALGKTGKPEVVDGDLSGDDVMHRAISPSDGKSAEHYAQQLLHGDLHVGSGFLASGIYAATGKDSHAHASFWAGTHHGGGQDSLIVAMQPKPGAVLKTRAELQKQLDAQFAGASEEGEKDLQRAIASKDKAAISKAIAKNHAIQVAHEFYSKDLARYAAAVGVDVITDFGETHGDSGEAVVVNRGAMRMSSQMSKPQDKNQGGVSAAPEAAKNPEPPAISPGLEKDLISWVADGKPDDAGALADIHDSLTPSQQEYLAEKASEHPSLSGWKSALLAGKSPTPEQHAAKIEHLQKDHEAVSVATKEVIDAIGPKKYLELVAPHHPEIQKSQALSGIDWDAHLLPESNTNAKSHNAKVKTIQEAAYKGDVAALQAMKFGSNTYGKKQAKLAKQAIRALGGRVSAKAAPASDGASPGIAAAMKMAQAKASTVDTRAPTLDGWKAALIAGTVPTVDQDNAAVTASEPDFQAAKKEIVAAIGNAKFNELTGKVGRQDAAPQAAGKDKAALGAPTFEGAKAALLAGKPPSPKQLDALGDASPQTLSNLISEAKKTHGPGKFGELMSLAHNLAEQNPKEGDVKTVNGHQYQLINGRWHRVDQDRGAAKQAGAAQQNAIPTVGKQAPIPPGASRVQGGKPAAPALSKEALIDGWHKAIEKGQAPTKEQAEAIESLSDDRKMEEFIAGASSLIPHDINWDDDKAINAAHDAADGKLRQLHSRGLKSQPSRAAKPAVMFVSPASASAPTADTAVSIEDWTEQPGTQKGSNPGGLYTDTSGQPWYVKFPKSEDHVKNELLAAKLYQAAGVAAPELQVISKGGKIGIASKWQDGLSKAGSDIKHADGALEGFAVDAWLGNYDSVGTGYDNLLKDASGKAVRIDVGGSLIFRAQGAKKTDFGNKVKELQTMLDSGKNTYAAAVFGGITPEQIEAGVAKVAAISEAQIKQMVDQFGPGDDAAKADLTKKLIARRKDLLKQYPEAAKKAVSAKLDPTALPVDPTQLPPLHDFHNWNGPGKGLSSKGHVNDANKKAEQDLFDFALKGNLVALKNYQFMARDKETGAPLGLKPISEHPSTHVKLYHSDLVAYLDQIANPPAPPKEFAPSDLAGLQSKSLGLVTHDVPADERLGFWIALGKLAHHEQFIPSKFSEVSLSAKAKSKELFHSLSKLTKRFVSRVQASGTYNDYFRDGHEKDSDGYSTDAIAQSVYQEAAEKPEGTTIYRWMNMPDTMVEQLLKTSPGTVFQNPGSMCTSMHPTATAHFGKHRMVIRYAHGAKAIDSFASGHYSGEEEITSLMGQRFVILRAEMQKELGGMQGKEGLELEVLMLPPDESYISNLADQVATTPHLTKSFILFLKAA